jgi:transcriptional regulator with XRE-family HTH domain
MGHSRPRPKHLAAKLLQIRQRLGLSQPKLAKVLGVREYTDISKYERDINEAPLAVLLAYSRASGVSLEQIVDDELLLDLSRISPSENAQI